MFDVLTIAAVADELAATLLDGRVQRVGLVDGRTLAAEVYAGGRRRALVASADDRDARLLLTGTMPSLDAELVTPFGLLLRKYVGGGVLVGVEQPPLERLVRLSIAKRLPPHNGRRTAAGRPDHDASADEPLPDRDDGLDPDDDHDAEGEGDATYVHLAVELMGRHSNLILIDDEGRIMESAKRVTPAMSRVRSVLPRLPYTPPPLIDKPDPRRLTAPAATELLATERPNAALAAVLVRRLRGLSPQMAAEIAFRVAGHAAVTLGALPLDAATAVARETRALLEPLLTSAWAPRVYRERPDAEATAAQDSDHDAQLPVIAFAAVPLASLAAKHVETAVASISAAAELASGEGALDSPVRHAQRRGRLLVAIRTERSRQERRLASLRAQAAKAAEAETLRERGDFIYAYLWQIEPGQSELLVDGVAIPLDPTLDAKANAQDYFERYRKAKDAGAQLPDLEATGQAELDYLDQLATLTDQAAGFADLEALQTEWVAHGGGPREAARPRRRAPDRRPRPLLDAAGNAVYIGRSGAQNDLVTFDLAGPNDTWLHARGVPGSHVVVRWHGSGDEEAPVTIEAAAALAAFYSAARNGATVEVDVTRRRHVRKIKGSGPGMVTYRNERTLAVRPADEAGVGAALKSE